MKTALDLDDLRRWVGREQAVDDVIAPHPARALAALLNHDTAPGEGDALPPAWQWLHFLDAPRADTVGIDGHPRRGGFLPPVPLERRMWAAGRLQCHAPLRIGERATRRSTVRSVDLKAGQSGTLVFVEVGHRYEQGGRVCLEETQNLVYRAAPTAPAPLPPGEPLDLGAFASAHGIVDTVVPDPAYLFRYSALTYNGHRIHYDRGYATDVEFYPGLVVHGPLMATLLLDRLARERPDREVAEFAFRARRPAFDGRPLALHARIDGDAATLCTADADGFVAVHATAVLR